MQGQNGVPLAEFPQFGGRLVVVMLRPSEGNPIRGYFEHLAREGTLPPPLPLSFQGDTRG